MVVAAGLALQWVLEAGRKEGWRGGTVPGDWCWMGGES